MAFERCHGLRNDRKEAAGEVHDRAEVVLQLGSASLFRASAGVNRDWLTGRRQEPTAQIEKMARLFQEPVADAADVVAPALRTLRIGPAPQLDRQVARRADCAGIDHL